jgi:deoxyribonuclease V
MFACVDVDYREASAVAACVLFHHWTDGDGYAELIEQVAEIQPYKPGQFFRRELPCLLAVLRKVAEPLRTVIVDGYVWLRDEQSPGLGAHLFDALERTIPVIGVAKTRFQGAAAAREVVRGDSRKPLFVTTAGIDLDQAARQIQEMHGTYRIPTLLKRVDQLCRRS